MMKHKKCSKCLITKPLNDFYKNKRDKSGFRSNCIDCGKKYKIENSEKIKEQVKTYNEKRKLEKKKWSEQNKDKVNISRKKWTDKNIDKKRQYVKDYNKKYYKKNKTLIQEYSKLKQKEYRKTNPLFRIKSNLRRRINRFIQIKSKSTEEILCITFTEFMKYIESKFTEGMSIDKLGKEIHIDHIIPLSSAKTEGELYKLCHYTNLQPLWAKDNLVKSNKLDYLYNKINK